MQDELISRQVALDVEGIDEQIRCEMCRNPMRTDRGCDGNCKYDEKLYERIMQILDERIKPLSSVQPDIGEFLRSKSPKEHREILHWIAIHYYPRDSKEVLQAVSEIIKPDTNGGSDD